MDANKNENENENESPGEEEEELDPRIQSELERLNRASYDINNLELSMQDARSKFRSTLNESTSRLDALARKLGNCVEKARPYYQARMNARTIQSETQKSALRYERACSMHSAAKEMVNVAEQGFLTKGQQFDTAWQEMLNHATIKVNEAETEIMESELEHAKMTYIFHKSEQMVKKLHRQHRRVINKSRPYFELKSEFNRVMDERKNRVDKLLEELKIQKSIYSCVLKTLERISDEIHAARGNRQARHALGERVSGVGAENPDPSPEERAPAEEPKPEVDVYQRNIAESSRATSIGKAGSPTAIRSSRRSSGSPSRPSSNSPAKDSMILNVGALQEEYAPLPYAKVTPKKSVSPSRKAWTSEVVTSEKSDHSNVADSALAAGNDAVSTRDTVCMDSEDILDTDSDSSSVYVLDDDLIADAMNDFTEEDFADEGEKFNTLPANMNFADLQNYFKRGELKRWDITNLK